MPFSKKLGESNRRDQNERKNHRFLSIFLPASLRLQRTDGAKQRPEESEQIQTAVEFTDDLGRTVTVENPQRVAVLLGSFAQVWTLAGGTVQASADDAWTDFQLDLPEDAVNLGGTKQLSLEKLLAVQPDFIIASTNPSSILNGRKRWNPPASPLPISMWRTSETICIC